MDVPALLWRSAGQDVRCLLCAHFCRIPPGGRGKCSVRENRGGSLVSLSSRKVAALHLDPVEKKPLFHFLPGTATLSVGAPGCNMRCAFCQNWSLSCPSTRQTIHGEAISPAELIGMALASGAASMAYTYSEPTVFFELMAETAKLALNAGLRNIMVSNGFQSHPCLEALGPLIQAANIDLKSFNDTFYRDICGARLRPVLKNLVHMKKVGWHLEVTTLVIPGLNDSDRELAGIARFLRTELGENTPWHVSRFHPACRMQDIPPTPPDTLLRAVEIGRTEGLFFVFAGNMRSRWQNTVCPCGATLIEREGFTVLRSILKAGACPACGRRITAGEERSARP